MQFDGTSEEKTNIAFLSERYKANGRHTVYAAGKAVPSIAKTRSLSLPVIEKIVARDNDAPTVSLYLVKDENETVGV